MPTILITCDYCGNSKESYYSFDVDDFCERCPYCNNDSCDQCATKESAPYHPECKEMGTHRGEK